ncbi:hypothetical protein DPMN_094196 [Dreissena polymorpha]|uniref:Uncharacterized protein n=1 Tax=Dreissena polymorpha TaxID=45954 RepID=A0A9D4L707_DREPO|nr:hypothetical protein DPMN_094196 [Dreissena polymorpha]
MLNYFARFVVPQTEDWNEKIRQYEAEQTQTEINALPDIVLNRDVDITAELMEEAVRSFKLWFHPRSEHLQRTRRIPVSSPMVFGFEPGTLLVKGDSSDRGSIPGTIAYEASARCLRKDPGCKPQSERSHRKLRVHTGTRTKQPSLTYHTEHPPTKRPAAEMSFPGGIAYRVSAQAGHPSRDPLRRVRMLRLESKSLTGKVLRLGLKPKDPSFKKGVCSDFQMFAASWSEQSCFLELIHYAGRLPNRDVMMTGVEYRAVKK